jgi:hypothetical protein
LADIRYGIACDGIGIGIENGKKFQVLRVGQMGLDGVDIKANIDNSRSGFAFMMLE